MVWCTLPCLGNFLSRKHSEKVCECLSGQSLLCKGLIDIPNEFNAQILGVLFDFISKLIQVLLKLGTHLRLSTDTQFFIGP